MFIFIYETLKAKIEFIRRLKGVVCEQRKALVLKMKHDLRFKSKLYQRVICIVTQEHIINI